MRILLLSGYDAASHKRWREQLTQHLRDDEWVSLALPPRFFSWRLKGNPLSWSFGQKEKLHQQYDRLIVTSMVDLAVLRGLVPTLAAIPTIVYFHENQFAYPIKEAVVQREVFHFCMHNLYTALCADVLLFNSDYNRQTFLDGVKKLLKKMPDQVPKGILEPLEEQAEVLPVPLEHNWFIPRDKKPTGAMHILWNHRWEYDKAPERFFGALKILKKQKKDFTVHVVGQVFRQSPSIFEEAREWLQEHIGHWGYIESKSEYVQCLKSCDVVVSTALHDFQGLAMLEAVAAGCHPVAPNRLAYPQWFPKSHLYDSSENDQIKEEQALADHLSAQIDRIEQLRSTKAPDVSNLSWLQLAPVYKQKIMNAKS